MVTEKRIDEIYTSLDLYIIDLLDDPKSLGPTYLQERMATCRNHLNRVSLLFSELSRAKQVSGADLRAYEDAFKLEYDELLATDETIKRLSNIEDRKSTVAHTLRQSQIRINETKREVAALEAVLKVVVHRQRELHSTMDILKEQRRLMDSEIKSGAMYGDERVPEHGKGPGGGVDVDEITGDELDDLLAPEPEQEVVEETADEPAPVVAEVVQEPQAASEPEVVVVEELEVVEQLEVAVEPEVVHEAPTPEPPPSVEVQEAPLDQDEQAIQRFLQSKDEPVVDTKTPEKTAKPSEEQDLLEFLDSL